MLEASGRVQGAPHTANICATGNVAKTYGHLGKHADATALRTLYCL